MKNFNALLILSVTLTLLFPGTVFADTESSLDQAAAKVIFVRGAETAKTRSLKYNVYIGPEYVGRMKVNDRKEVDIAAGVYKVSSNFYKGSSLEVTLQAGKIYTISTAMETKANGKGASFKLVSEDLASTEAKVINTDS